ncbi:MAG: hypothetical protein MUO77_01025, partial [Anaerolineales bacterium]|nr:hypothetical protein [Anaerolineales bacterium]
RIQTTTLRSLVPQLRIQTTTLRSLVPQLRIQTTTLSSFVPPLRIQITTLRGLVPKLRNFCSTCGREAVKSVLRLFDELAKCDNEGILKNVRKAVEGTEAV